ncbi:MAG TPA: FecR domain-containing protein [Terriglobales bacterium]
MRILALAMAVLLPANLTFAESRAALAVASGMAALNGTALSHSATIFVGDQLETSTNSAVTISLNGTTVLIGANSRMHYFGESVALHSGSMQVSTSKGMKLQTDTVTIEPNKTEAKFRVDRGTKTVQVAALAGELKVFNGEETRVLEPGTTVTLQEQDDDQAPSPVKGPSNRKLFIYVASAAGGAAAVIYMTHDEKKPISNQIP